MLFSIYERVDELNFKLIAVNESQFIAEYYLTYHPENYRVVKQNDILNEIDGILIKQF